MSASALGNSVVGTGALNISSLFNVEGRVAIGMSPILVLSQKPTDHTVTGGGTGLGLVTATALAENGCKVYITGRRLETLETAAKENSPKNGKGVIIPIQADASTKEGILCMSCVQ
jgi:pyruvate/2-oxoglutarate dehydrogenase complex dihydrolipoamide dehydrogenase (E3) component